MRESLSPCSPSSLALASLEAVAVLLVVDYYSCRPFLHLPLSPTMLSLRALSAFRPCRLTGRWPSLSTSTVQGPLGLLGEDEGEGRGRAARAQACGAVPVVVGSRRGRGAWRCYRRALDGRGEERHRCWWGHWGAEAALPRAIPLLLSLLELGAGRC